MTWPSCSYLKGCWAAPREEILVLEKCSTAQSIFFSVAILKDRLQFTMRGHMS